MTEEAKQIVEILRDEDNCNVLDYIDEAADLIESMYAELDRVTKERDAAVEDLRMERSCATCRDDNTKDHLPFRCASCGSKHCNWQWRGIKE